MPADAPTDYDIKEYSNTPQNRQHVQNRTDEGWEVYMETEDVVRLRRPVGYEATETESEEDPSSEDES